MTERQTIVAANIPGRLSRGISPSTEGMTSEALAQALAIPHTSLERLIKRRRRELRSYGPLLQP